MNSEHNETNELVVLPAVVDGSQISLDQVTRSLGVSRTVLASDHDIKNVWNQLPTLLNQIPIELRKEEHARLCVAVSVGLFDAAINYAWNSAVVELRNRVDRFGFTAVEQLTKQSLDVSKLRDLKDAELLDLCLRLNLISEDASFFLSQCRDMRNNFSSAHPPLGSIDGPEVVVFFNRCIKYAFQSTVNPTGVDTAVLLNLLKRDRFTDDQLQEWCARISNTHDAQRQLIYPMLHGVYCDPDSSEVLRQNSLAICLNAMDVMSERVKSEFINRHSEYQSKGDDMRTRASQDFFQKLGLIGLLDDAQRHVLFSKASSRLLAVHTEMNNFFNEPAFAERLLELSQQAAPPASCRGEFVYSVVTCAIGNEYGVSNAAMPTYRKLIANFSPQEVDLMLGVPESDSLVGRRVKNVKRCREAFVFLLKSCVNPATVQTKSKVLYDKYVNAH